MKKILFFLAFSVFLYGADIVNIDNQTLLENGKEEKINELKTSIRTIKQSLESNDLLQQYNTYYDYLAYKEEKKILEEELKKHKKTSKTKEEIEEKLLALNEKIDVLKDYEDYSFIKSINIPQTVEAFPKIKNPIHIISAFSHIKELSDEEKKYQKDFSTFSFFVDKLSQYARYQEQLFNITQDEKIKLESEKASKQYNDFMLAYDRAKTSLAIYTKKVDEEINRIKTDIKSQFFQMLNIFLGILIVIALFLLVKKIVKKYVEDSEKIYTLNKMLNLAQISIVLLVLLFAYIDNISYLVTVLGFASAGIAIAMRDMFMSMLGWFVIIFGGSFKVGDRVRVVKNNVTYVGDIVDISLLKMTIYEDVTLGTLLSKERRAGRMIYVPNNIIFTELMANYTHANIYTLYDVVEIYITFDSNLSKVEQIIKDIVNPITQNAVNTAKNTMKKLRHHYNVRYAKTETRVFTNIEREGVKISACYLCYTREALKTRTLICQKILEEFKKHDDIKLAYQTHMVYMQNYKNMPFNGKMEQDEKDIL